MNVNLIDFFLNVNDGGIPLILSENIAVALIRVVHKSLIALSNFILIISA